jgi:hypothetical protein
MDLLLCAGALLASFAFAFGAARLLLGWLLESMAMLDRTYGGVKPISAPSRLRTRTPASSSTDNSVYPPASSPTPSTTTSPPTASAALRLAP